MTLLLKPFTDRHIFSEQVERHYSMPRLRRAFSLSLYTISSIAFLSACSSSNSSTTAAEQQILVDQSAVAVNSIFNNTEQAKHAEKLLTQSRAVMICPSISNLSLVFGGSKGRCTLLSRDARGSWSDPAFYYITSGTFGLQLGYQNSQLVLFITSQKGIQALLDHQFTFDANASASFSSLASSAQKSRISGDHSDIYALQKANGIFAGAALGGSKLSSDSYANRAYYQQYVGPEDIVINMRVNNPAADPLRRALMNAEKKAN